MKQMIISGLALAAALSIALPSVGRSARRAQAQAQYSASDEGAGKWGIGFGYLPGRNGAIDALSATYRLNPNLDLDGLLLGGVNSVANGGSDASGNPVNDSGSNFGLGAQARYNLLHPTQDLAFQVLGRLSYVTESNTHTVLGTNTTSSDGQVGLFVGAGFEGFIPAWRSVSIEVNSGLNILLTGVSVAGAGSSESAVYLGSSNANAVVPFNLAVHYYF